jgi:hypothetical protein
MASASEASTRIDSRSTHELGARSHASSRQGRFAGSSLARSRGRTFGVGTETPRESADGHVLGTPGGTEGVQNRDRLPPGEGRGWTDYRLRMSTASTRSCMSARGRAFDLRLRVPECQVLEVGHERFADEAVAARRRSLRSESSVARSIQRSTRRLSRA